MTTVEMAESAAATAAPPSLAQFERWHTGWETAKRHQVAASGVEDRYLRKGLKGVALLYALIEQTRSACIATDELHGDAFAMLNTAVNFSLRGGFPTEVSQAVVTDDAATLLAASVREGWTNDTPVPPDVFGPLWGDHVAATLPVVIQAKQSLTELVGDYSPPPIAEWQFLVNGGVADGLRVTVGVPAWGVSTRKDFNWEELRDARYVRGEVQGLWARQVGRHGHQLLHRVLHPEVL